MKKIIRHIVFFSVLSAVLFPPRAHAYLDPGTGSYILQIVAAVFFAGIFLVKTWWTQIKGFLGRFAKKEGKEVKNSEKSSGKKKE
ncbi:MAG: hypothetical protein KBC00_00370 [Candidatus Levybacteria bacterium]|nr:hypothetical protein [Candidatus Levybacteria bacterium]MBP9815171.1 hypothetical protein [Candidatus Levybacteria bacterium]